VSEGIRAGERFSDPRRWEDEGRGGPHIWRTLAYERDVWEPGRTVIRWNATADYAFPARDGHIVHGGMVATVLDSAMGGAAWTVLDNDESFLTADLHVEFIRASRPGMLSADGRVVQRNRRVIFCSAELFDDEGTLLAAARCTQVVLPSR
jgi:uncharacterized protein (TIGR00369 family)